MKKFLQKILLAITLACGAAGVYAQVPVGARIALDAATNNQVNGSGGAGNTLRATVTNAQAQPLAGVTVSWRDDPAFTGGPLSGTAVTDANGVAQFNYLANGPSGRLVITCLPAPDNAVCVVFTILAGAGGNSNTVPNQGQPLNATVTPTTANSRVVLVSGNNQSGSPGVALAQPLVARLESVVGGAGVPSAAVEWLTLDGSGTGSLTLVTTTQTDATGQTQISFTPPNANPGRQVIAGFPGGAGNTGNGGNSTFNVNVTTPALNCAPTVSPAPATTGQPFTINGNCTINGAPAASGTETWTFPAASGITPATQTRTLPAALLTPAIATAGTYNLSVTFTSGTTVSGAFPLAVTVAPPPAVACAPSFSPSPAFSGQSFTINGNCTINGVAAANGTENWSIPAIGAQSAVNVNRVLPATPIQRVVTTPGSYSFSLQFTSPSGNSPVYAVPIVIAQNPTTAAPSAQDIKTVQGAIAAASNTAVRGIRTQFDLIQRRFQYIRSGGPAGFVSDIGVNASVNGRTLPLLGGSGGASGGGRQEEGSQGQSSGSGASASARSEEAEGTRTGRWGAYIMGGVDVQKLKGEGGFKITTNGLTAGADYRLNRAFVVGGALGYMKSDTGFADSASGQDADGLSVTLYGSFEPAPSWFVDAGFSSSRNNFDLRRVTAAGGTALASTKGSGNGLTLSAGYTFKRDGWLLSPYGRVDTLRVSIREFSEAGDSPLAIGSQGLKSTVLTAGGTAQYAISTGYGIVVPQARLELQRQAQNSVRSVTARLVGSSVQVVVDPSLGIDKSFGQFGVGVSAQLRRGISLFADYEQSFGKSSFSEYRASTGVKVEF
jgi:large repetitive protein